MLKRLIAFLKNLFKKELTIEQMEENKRVATLKKERTDFVKEKIRRSRLTDAEARYEWLCSTGYTPKVHIAPDPKPDVALSCFRVMVNKCKDKGFELRKAGKKVIQLSARKNKWGIDVLAYGI